MSTKIYDGYRLGPDADVFGFARRMRLALDPVRDRLDASWLVHHAVSAADQADRDGVARAPRPLMAAMCDFDDAQRRESDKGHIQAESSRQFNPHRFEASIGLDAPRATGERSGTNRILVRIYTERSELREAFEALPEVEPWGYWNNADPPKGCTSQDWEMRSRAWSRVTAGFEAPVRSMLTFSLRSDHYDPTMVRMCTTESYRDLLREVAPGLEDRVRARMRDLCFAAELERTGQSIQTIPLTEVLRLVRSFDSPGADVASLPEHAAARDACEQSLDPGVVEWILGSREDQAPVVDMRPAVDVARTAAADLVRVLAQRDQDGIEEDR